MNLLILPAILGLGVLCAVFGIREAEPLLLWLACLPALALAYVPFEVDRQEAKRWRRHHEALLEK